ncbi:MAG: hypothetical protein HY921_01040 [Elusimicrobia bacterium]|nr:hypothetical protein [Elusimicrobiota bacterium]
MPRLTPALAYRRLLKTYGPQGWWPVTPADKGETAAVYRPGYFGPLSEPERAEVCAGAILTQNTAWSNVSKALVNLHAAGIWTLADLARTPRARLEKLVRPSGYFRQKAKKLQAFAKHILAGGNGLGLWLEKPLSELREELLTIWGIGPETADSMLLYAAGKKAFVVDAYTLRIGRRLGWLKNHGYAEAQAFFTASLPARARVYSEFHALLVALAKLHCRVKPLCRSCPLLAFCPHGQAQHA